MYRIQESLRCPSEERFNRVAEFACVCLCIIFLLAWGGRKKDEVKMKMYKHEKSHSGMTNLQVRGVAIFLLFLSLMIICHNTLKNLNPQTNTGKK